MHPVKFGRLLFSIFICEAAGIIGGLFTAQAIPTWYAALVKPSFNPPNWAFGPVWIILYAMMGVSFYLLWNVLDASRGEKKCDAKTAMIVFGVQLLLNLLWTFIFFGLHSPLAAIPVIILLWIAILLTIWLAYPLSRHAANLLVPYILWVSFASILNIAIFLLN